MGPFEFIGEKYEKASRHQKEWGKSLISKLQLNGNEVILDLGCGDGALTEQLAFCVPDGNVLGIDASIGMIETAKKNKKDNLQFMQMDMNQLNFENKFDVIYSNAALHWVKDHKLLLKNVFRALKPGGTIAWNFGGNGTCSNFFEVIKGKMQEEKYQKYFQSFEWPWYMPSKQEYDALIKDIDFSKVSVEKENRDRYFSNADEMIGWLDQPTLVPFIECVPDELKKIFREETAEAMVKKTKQPDGRCFETFRRIQVYAVK